MKRYAIPIFILMFAMSAGTITAQNINTGISISDGQLRNFYFSIGDYYHVPESRVVHVKDRYHMQDEELPVLFFLASHANVDPQAIIDLRIGRGMSWLDITFHFGLTPEIYYVPVRRVGPPYGNAYGYYKKHKNNYRKVVLADNDVVNLVNLRFMSDYHGVAPEVIMDKRGKGERFFVMNNELNEAKGKKGNSKSNQKKGSNKNNGRGKGNGRG